MAATYDLHLRDTREDTLIRWDSAGKAASGVVLGSKCYVHEAVARNGHASATLYLMFFDATTVPDDGAVPVFLGGIAVPPGGHADWSPPRTQPFLTGCVWACSTTADTLTLGGADLAVNVTYET